MPPRQIKLKLSRKDLKNPAIIVALLVLALFGVIDLPSPAELHTGATIVIDGDTIDIQGQRFRLFGIDAPEGAQKCKRNGQDYLCGIAAKTALANLIGQQPVTCEKRDDDSYNRIVAICTVGQTEINRWLVAHGYALAYRHYSHRYVAAEEEARAAKRGLWAGSFENPWDYRHAQKNSQAGKTNTSW